MAQHDFEERVDEVRNRLPHQLSTTIRTRFDDTYMMIRHMEKQVVDQPQRTLRIRKPIRNGIVTASAAALLGMLILSPIWIPQAAAETLRKTPIVGSIFKLAGDLGLRKAEEDGLATIVNESAALDGISITATKVLYDGIRIAMELTRSAPEETDNAFYHLESIMNHSSKKGSFEDIQVWLPSGQYGSLNLGTDQVTDPSESVLVEMQDLSGDIPDQFEMIVKIGLKGYKQPIELSVPVVKMADQTVIASNFTKIYEGKEVQIVANIESTPISTRLTINTAEEPLLRDLSFDIVDDMGTMPKLLSGSLNPEKGAAYTFEAFGNKPKSITVKPYLQWREKHYIPELQFTIPVPEE